MKNKKIVLALSLVLALGATMVVGGSLAWFSDTDEATNTFTVGSVEIVQKETGKDGTTPFEQDQQLIPVVENGKTDPTEFANFIHKQVTVENTGNNPAYVQTFIAVPKALDNGLLHWDVNLTADGWKQVGTGAVGTMAYDLDNDPLTADDTLNVYCYRYATALAKKGETGDKSSVLLNGVYIDEAADLNVYRDEQTDAITKACFVWNSAEITEYDVSKIEKLPVLVATQAIQSQGFENAAAAFNSGAFPNHPWA